MKTRFYFEPSEKGTAVFLGPTEARLMDLVWEKKSLTVKTALYSLGTEDEPAYTTVMPVLGRLADKGWLLRGKRGRGFVYKPAADKSTFPRQRFQVVDDGVKGNFKNIR